MTRIAFILMLFCVASCKSPTGYHVKEYQEVKVEEIPADIKIPTKAWEMLEFKGHNEDAAHPVAALNLVFSEVTVFLVQKNPGVVEGEAIKILLPKGGGTVDLSRYITTQQGSFYVGFEFPAFEDAKSKKVLFVSGTKKRKIGDKILGAGCNQFLDITDQFLKEMKGDGLIVNTTQERYLTVMGGTFIIAAQKEKDVHLAQVTFKHSSYTPLFCEVQ